MICMLDTVKTSIKAKKIYIWNINRDSMDLFLQVALCRISIQGFVTNQAEYVGQMYMNRSIVSLEQVKMEENSIVLLADRAPKDILNMFPPGRAVFWANALEINKELQHKRIIIYGIGGGAEQLKKRFSKERIAVDLYCVTKKDKSEHYRDKRVIEVTEIGKYEDHAVIISVKRATYCKEILEALRYFNGQIYVEKNQLIAVLGLIQSLDIAIKKNRKVYLYSKRNHVAEWVEDVLGIYGIKISGYVGESEGDTIENTIKISELAHDGTDDKLIIINEDYPDPERFIEMRKNVEAAGFSLEKSNYTSLNRYTLASEWMLHFRQEQYYDPLLGFSKAYSYGKIGWKQYGEDEIGRIKILVLGNSASSEEFHPENWVSKVYKKLLRKNIRTTIFNGAYPDDDIVSELLRLLRDGYAMKPQIVISMSGVNNMQSKEAENQFNEARLIGWAKQLASEGRYSCGIECRESPYSFWNRNIKLLNLVSEFYGARFFGFLMPMNATMSHMGLQEKSMFEAEANIEGAREFAAAACDGDGYINLMRIFEHQEEMFIDTMHYTDKAHEIIADQVCEAIMPEIQSLIKEGYI